MEPLSTPAVAPLARMDRSCYRCAKAVNKLLTCAVDLFTGTHAYCHGWLSDRSAQELRRSHCRGPRQGRRLIWLRRSIRRNTAPSYQDDLQEENKPQPAAPSHPAQHHSGGGGLLGDIGSFFTGAAHQVSHFVTRTIPNAGKKRGAVGWRRAQRTLQSPGTGPAAVSHLEEQAAPRPGATVSQPRMSSGPGHLQSRSR